MNLQIITVTKYKQKYLKTRKNNNSLMGSPYILTLKPCPHGRRKVRLSQKK